MKVALPIWEGGLSPVFDVARVLLVVEMHKRKWVHRYEIPFSEEGLLRRVLRVIDLGVDVLICGAISKDMEDQLKARHVTVISWVSGDPDQVLKAYCAGELPHPRFAMPGCLQNLKD
jgi:predicted Fe-Mo cluster-binding NifX family protein